MLREDPDATTIAILAKAPVAGYAKTRLIPALGAHAAAVLQDRLTERAVRTACAAALGPVVLWCSPDCGHPSFGALAAEYLITVAQQPGGDLGQRMLAAIEHAGGPVLVIGTDCPSLTRAHLHSAATVLREVDLVVIPAEDGGYVLIGMSMPRRKVFSDIAWGSAIVMAETRRRIVEAGLSHRELAPLWDVDRAADLDRMEREGLSDLLT